jgi:hypothetical protein
MASLLQQLVELLGAIGEIEALSYPETVRRWVIRDITVVAGLLAVVQMQTSEDPRFHRAAIGRLLSDEYLKARTTRLVKDISAQQSTEALLKCMLQHEATFAALADILNMILPAETTQ